MAVLRRTAVVLIVPCLLSLANAQQPGATNYTPALDVTAMDRTIDPCVDFFAYSCGG